MLTLMADSLDGNVHYLVRSVRDQLGTLIEAGDGIGLYLLAIALDWTFRDKGVRRADRWRRLGQELEKEHARELARWFEAEPWSAPQPPDPETVERYGPGSLYLRGWILNASYPPHVLAVLSSGRGNAIRQRLMGEKTPWRLPQTLRSTSGTAERMLGYFGARGWPEAGPELATFLVLALPYLETIAKEKASLGEIESKRALELIDIRRKSGQGSQGVRAPARAGMPDDAWAFLRDWAFGRFSVLPDQVS